MSNKKDFASIIGRAQALMLNEDFNKKVESRAVGAKNMDMGTTDLSLLEAQAFGGMSSYQSQPINQYGGVGGYGVNNNADIDLSRIPEGLRESFAKMPPIQGDPNSVDPLAEITERLSLQANNSQPRQIVREEYQPQPQIQPQPQYGMPSQGIDYSLLRTIIDESVKKCFNAYSKKMLNESTVKGFRICGGNKIQLMDNKGNLYEGVLQLKKSANK